MWDVIKGLVTWVLKRQKGLCDGVGMGKQGFMISARMVRSLEELKDVGVHVHRPLTVCVRQIDTVNGICASQSI